MILIILKEEKCDIQLLICFTLVMIVEKYFISIKLIRFYLDACSQNMQALKFPDNPKPGTLVH